MDKRVTFIAQDGKRLNSVVMNFGEMVFFFKQTGNVGAEEQAIINGFLKTVETTKTFPIHPDAAFIEISNPITNEVIGAHDLNPVNEVNFKTRNIKFFRPASRVGAPKHNVEPFDLPLKNGTNITIQELPDGSV